MKLIHVSTTSQLADILTKQRHFQQYLACVTVAGILGQNLKVTTTSLEGTFVLTGKRGPGCFATGNLTRKAIMTHHDDASDQVESRTSTSPSRPLRGWQCVADWPGVSKA